MAREPVDILGAGLCGSLLSIMLARQGCPVTLWERQSDPRKTRVPAGRSINLAMAARGIRALQIADVFEPVQELLVPMRGRMIHHPDGSTELQPYGARDDEQIYSVSRAELNRILLDRAEGEHGVDIRFGHAVESYDSASHSVVMRQTGSDSAVSLRDKILIAADGAGSVLRRAFNDDDRIAPTEELLPHGYKELTLPAGKNGNYQLEPNALHIWPRGGYMLIALPNPGGDFTLTLFLANKGELSFESLNSDAVVLQFFENQFADLLPLLPNLTEEFASNPVGILGTVRCQQWHAGKLLLIGDAAHAIVPFHGQGMNLAFEDCALLESKLVDSGGDYAQAFAAFAAEQLPNANAIADMALDNYIEMRDRVRDPEYLLLKQLAFELERRLPERLIPRYSMVMFHPEIPYAVAQRRGREQQAVLRDIAAGAKSLDEIDLDAAARTVCESLDTMPIDRTISQ